MYSNNGGWNQFAGKWKQIFGGLRKRLGGLTGNASEQAHGENERLAGKIQQEYSTVRKKLPKVSED